MESKNEYSVLVFQILRLFSESAQSIGALKVDLAEAKQLLGARNKQLHQLWYRSVTLRHIISLLDQIEAISKVSLFLCFFSMIGFMRGLNYVLEDSNLFLVGFDEYD